MRFLLQLFVITLGAYILELFFPWWSIAIAAFIAGLIIRSNASFWTGFLAIATLWVTKALLIDSTAATILSQKVAAIFQLPSKTWLLLVMSIVGGLVGGFAALSGFLVRKRRKLRY